MHPIDKTDRKILAALKEDARMSITQLAAEAQVSRATAKARLDHLRQSGRIHRFTIETDVDVEGQIRAVSFIQLQGKMSRAVIRTLSKIPEVASLYSTNGAWDLVVNIQADSLAGFDRTLRDIREVPGVLNSESCLLLAPAGI